MDVILLQCLQKLSIKFKLLAKVQKKLTLDTVKKFLEDSKKSNFKI